VLKTSNRRQYLQTSAASLATALLGLSGWHSQVQAQSRFGRILVGFPVGGTADGIARALTQAMGTQAGAGFIVDSKPGAGGQIAADAIRQSAGDGLNLLLTPCSALTLTPLLYGKPMYEGLKDFAPVLGLCEHAFALAVPESSPYKTVADFVQGGSHKTINYATPGAGSGPHFLGVIFAQLAGIRLNQIPYRGVAPGIQDLMGNQVDATFNPLPSMLEPHKSGRIRILAVTSPKRIAAIPGIPTFTELGYGGVELMERFGLFVSTATPGPLVDQLQARFLEVMRSTVVLDMAKKLEIDIKVTPQLKQLQETERSHWQQLVKSTGITLDS
jgi:tripartite-type tricarboxylate transporter receptor subunit TctC